MDILKKASPKTNVKSTWTSREMLFNSLGMLRSGVPTFLLVLVAGFFLVRESRRPPVSEVDDAFATWLSLNGVPTNVSSRPAITLVDLDGEENEASLPSPLDISVAVSSAAIFQPAVEAIATPLDWTRAKLSEKEAEELPQSRKILENVLLQTPKIVLAGTFGREFGAEVPGDDSALSALQNVEGDATQVPEWTSLSRLPEAPLRASGDIGFTNLPSVDGEILSVPLVLRYRGALFPSFVLEAARLWARKTPAEVHVRLGSEITLGPHLSIPIDGRGQMRVNFRATWGTISEEDLVLAAREKEIGMPEHVPTEDLAGSVLLFAQNAKDRHHLRFPSRISGSEPELFAAAIATIQTRTFLRRPPVWSEWLIVILAAATTFFLPRHTKKGVLARVFIAWVTYGLFSMVIATFFHYCLPLVLPIGMGAILIFLQMALPGGRAEKSGDELEKPTAATA